jgi:antitoxin YefM
MKIISSREFRQNQRLYFERADKGEQIIVQRGKNKAYALTPVNEDDVYFNAGMVERIKESIKQVEEGKVKRISTPDLISDLLGL